ncbi:uncharacterized protein BYT42DRAFT_553682 [Radiomyces spectabilis]|uniref:uncharacterized protein n=1 Tax=Radiomyces spectabilis TaxID=64574 RepID=UPI00221FAF0F|nr:uncharacterized protein BYT42DRAFT_553682 [Radiomyces spectabilis]KAI8394197.1 hypothetical protein BYT42DRAFT_553682 [Radiomyces spectabilis]
MSSGIFDLKSQLVIYGAHHNNKVNVIIHMIFVPIILWSALVFGAKSGPLVDMNALPSSLQWLKLFGPNLSFFTMCLYSVYYMILDPVAAALASPLLFAACYHATNFLKTNPQAIKIALSIHIAAWIFQFLGHGVAEKRSPKVLDNLVQACVSAPYFVFFELLFACGYRPQLYREVRTEVEKDIAEFRARKAGKKNK